MEKYVIQMTCNMISFLDDNYLSGKTTMINGLANYIYGVQWQDEFRFKVVIEKGDQSQMDQHLSQTEEVSGYSFNWQEGMMIPYTLTIIDTPGFGDTEGIRNDKETGLKVSF